MTTIMPKRPMEACTARLCIIVSCVLVAQIACTKITPPVRQPPDSLTTAADSAYGTMLAEAFGPLYEFVEPFGFIRRAQFAVMTINRAGAHELRPQPLRPDSPTESGRNFNYATFRGMAQPNHAEARVFAAYNNMPQPVHTISIYTTYAPCETCRPLFTRFARAYPGVAMEMYYTGQWTQMSDNEVYTSLVKIQNAGWSIGRVCAGDPDDCWTFQRRARSCMLDEIPTLCANDRIGRVACVTRLINEWMPTALRSAEKWNERAETLGPTDHDANVNGINRCIGMITRLNYPVGPPLR